MDHKVHKFEIDDEEYKLKRALQTKDGKKIKKLLKSYNKQGNSLVSYLFKKNYSGLALKLTRDNKAKF